MLFEANGVIDNTKTLTISLPAQVHVDTYSAQIVFDNHGCADYTIPLTFDVHYAREVVGQRWNDVLAVKNDIVPPTINHEEGDEDPEIDYSLNFTFNTAQKREVRAALSNTFGFGGHNACVIFKKYAE